MLLNRGWAVRLGAAVLLMAGMQSVAHAQATRTWVSGVGDDANPCSRTAPCKTFAGAISKTAAGGEISVLDPGGYGGVTITKSITINNAGGEAGVLVSGTNGIVIAAAGTDRVTLRGLNIEGLATGISGVRITSAAEVIVDNCQIQGFRGANSNGILLAPSSGTTRLTVRNSTINANGASAGGAGINVVPSGSATAIADVDNVLLGNNFAGVASNSSATSGSVFLTIKRAQIMGSVTDGVLAVGGASGNHRVVVDDSVVADNAFGSASSAGVHASGAAASVRIHGNVIGNNRIGVQFDGSGTITSFGDNIISGNGTNGSFSSTQATQ